MAEKKTVLIVEDEESNYSLLQVLLRSWNVDLIWAQNGKEAITLCGQRTFDLILMDIKMPEMSGYEAIKKIRELGHKTPVIAQTAYARLEDEERAMESGFDGYISKPINRKKFESFLEKYLK